MCLDGGKGVVGNWGAVGGGHLQMHLGSSVSACGWGGGGGEDEACTQEGG